MSPARRRLGTVRAVAERLLRGTPRKSPAEALAETLAQVVPGVRTAALTLAAAREPSPDDTTSEDDDTVREPWLESADQADQADAEVLDRVTLRLDETLFEVNGVGYALPGPDLTRALETLGWTPENGLAGPVRDDVDTVSLHRPDDDSPPAYRSLWEAAVPVAREALVQGSPPGTVVPLPAPA